MSRVRANELTNKAADGSPSFPYGAVITVLLLPNFRKADGTGGGIGGVTTAGVSTLTDLIVEGLNSSGNTNYPEH